LALREAGAEVVLISGNHDSAARLGTRAAFSKAAGVHVLTRPEALATPVTIEDEHGPVHFYGIPFLEPAIVRSVWPDVPMRHQHDAMAHAVGLVEADRQTRGGRSVVIAHTFAQGAEGESCESERAIAGLSVGGVDKAPIPLFETVDYAALGHIHGRSQLAPTVRYSGAPLHYSFSEADKPRGGWVVDLDASGAVSVEWMGLPVPRALSRLRGTIDELLVSGAFDAHERDWVEVTLTDNVRPLDAMARLRGRFPWCAHVVFAPAERALDDGLTYTEALAGLRTDDEIIDAFLGKVRNGAGASEAEIKVIASVIASHHAAERAS
jgi:exonuclease SbcD